MVNEKSNKKNSLNLNGIDTKNNKVLDYHQSKKTSNTISDESFNEAFTLYNAINEGKVDLTPNEKKELINELNLIFNHYEVTSKKTKDVSKIMGIVNNSNNHFNKKSSSENVTSVNNGDVEHDKDFDKFPEIEFEKKLSTVNNEGVDDLSVDDALTDLFGNDDFLIEDNNDSTSYEKIENVSSVECEDSFTIVEEVDEQNVGSNLSVDEVLTDLIEDYSNEIAIKVNNVSMDFKVSKDKIDTLKEYFIRTVKRNKIDSKIFRALDDVSFEIPKGDRVGVIGFNGAGKSTLLKVLAGVYEPTEGTIEITGKIAPLLALNAGFDLNYTGKDNIFLNGALLGYSEEFLKEKYDEILEFSELGDAINYHVKTYSSGMRAKLGFSIATIVEPDILILDEILSVGDIKFKKKSADKIRSLINSGITVLLVSHSVNQIRDLCNKAIWIDHGKLKMYGEVNEVCDAYVKAASSATKDQLENIQLN